MSSVLTYNGHGLKLMTGSGYVRVSGEKYEPVVQYPYLLIYFADSSFTPTTNMLYDTFRPVCTWTLEDPNVNIWRLEIHKWVVDNFHLFGLSYLFRPGGDSGSSSLTMSCMLYGSGNMDVALDGQYCQTFDRMFYGATGLTNIFEPIHCTTVQNVGGMFQGCTNVVGGALDQYDWFSTYGVNINNHSGTFTDCGSNTGTGTSELAQIPVGWGGTQIPASTLMTSARVRWKSNYDTWAISANGPDWTNMNGVYLFTEGSVSAYAGVSMNRSRIGKFNSLNTAQGQAALYFYPCFMQHTSSAITWAVSTSSPNGTLTISQGNTDMPGTLDYSTYGPFSLEFGTYDSAGTVYFCFLVTSSPISSSFDLRSTPYGVLYNSNFKTDAGLRWFR